MPNQVSIRDAQLNGLTYHSRMMDRVKNANAGSLSRICSKKQHVI